MVQNSPVGGFRCWLHFVSFMKRAPMCMETQVYILQGMEFLEYMLKGGVVVSCDRSVFTLMAT